MSPTSQTTRARRRRHASFVSAVLIGALALSACTAGPAPAPSPTATPPPYYDPQPDFALTQAPAATPLTETSTTATISGSYSDTGVPYDVDQIMNASQGGYAPMTNTHWLTDRLPMVSEMGIQRVRLDHIFNDYLYHAVQKKADGTIAYDFSRLDQTIIPMLQQGIEPLIALTYTPGVWEKSPWAPPPLPEWTELVRALVTHYRDLGYTGWDWEVWNEPDGTNHWTGTFDQYNDLYAATATAVKNTDPSARVGGAAAAYLTSAGNVSGQFINYIASHPDVPIDFFSVHNYSTNNWNTVTASRQLLTAAGLADLPIIITEWGFHPRMTDGPGFGSDTNASPTGSSFMARQLFLAGASGAEAVYYFSPVEGLTFGMPYNGDLGLITVDGHRKSPGNVFEMYSRLGETRVELDVNGAGTDTFDVYGFLSKNSADSDTTLLLWNNTAVDADAAVNLSDLPFDEGNVRMTMRVVSGTQGNGFADTSTTIAPSYPSANENASVITDTVVAGFTSLDDTVRIPANGVIELALTATEREEGPVEPSWEPAAVNVAAAIGGTRASASSSVEDGAAGWGVAKAIDGRRYTVDVNQGAIRGWSSNSHPAPDATESLTIDLGAVAAVDSVTLWPYTTQGAAGSGFPVNGTIRGSVDGTEWVPLAEFVNVNGGAPVSSAQTFSFDVVEVRYITVEGTQLAASTGAGGGYAMQFAEVEAYRTGVRNGGFEAGDIDGWVADTDATVESATTHRGTYALQLGGEGGASTEVRGLRPDTTYTAGVFAKASDDAATLTVDLPEGAGGSTSSSATTWRHLWVTFTTGERETSAEIRLSGAAAIFDDVTVSLSGAAADTTTE